MATKRPLPGSSEAKKRQERLARFSAAGGSAQSRKRVTTLNEEEDSGRTEDASWQPDGTTPFVGTNQQLEKSYLRLTTFPRREDVRPLPVLIKALEHVKRKYQQNEDFDWCHDQLKSIRQDITVQQSSSSIQPEQQHPLLLDVYQTHARVLLEQGDLAEFHPCLTNVLRLYDARRPCRSNQNQDHHRDWSKVLSAQGEFRAYAILYSLIHNTPLDRIRQLRRRVQEQQQQEEAEHVSTSARRKKRRRRSDAADAATSPAGTPTTLLSPEETVAWQVVRAVQDGNDLQFFRLYAHAPHLSPYLMDFLVQRVRVHACRVLVAAVRPTLSLPELQERWQFQSREELRLFLRQQQVVLTSNGEEVDCRQSHRLQGSL